MESFLFNSPEGMNRLEFYLECIGLKYFKDKWMTPRELKRDRDPYFISHFHAATSILRAKIEEGRFEENCLLISHFKQVPMTTDKTLKFWSHITKDFSLFGQYSNGENEGTLFLRLRPGRRLIDSEEVDTSGDVMVLNNGGNPHIKNLLEYLYNTIMVYKTEGITHKELANRVENELGQGTYPRRFIEDLISQIKII